MRALCIATAALSTATRRRSAPAPVARSAALDRAPRRTPIPPEHGHSHGLVHDSIKRSSEGMRAVVLSLAVLGATAIVAGGRVRRVGQRRAARRPHPQRRRRLTASRSASRSPCARARAEGYAGLAVVAAIFISALVAGAESIRRLIDPARRRISGYSPPPERSATWATGSPRRSAPAPATPGHPALIADGNHARADAYVSLAVVAAAAAVAVGVPILDPIIGITHHRSHPAHHVGLLAHRPRRRTRRHDHRH